MTSSSMSVCSVLMCNILKLLDTLIVASMQHFLIGLTTDFVQARPDGGTMLRCSMRVLNMLSFKWGG